MNMGTKMGAKMYHFAVPLVMKKLTKVVTRRIARIRGTPVRPMLSRKVAALTAITMARFV